MMMTLEGSYLDDTFLEGAVDLGFGSEFELGLLRLPTEMMVTNNAKATEKINPNPRQLPIFPSLCEDLKGGLSSNWLGQPTEMMITQKGVISNRYKFRSQYKCKLCSQLKIRGHQSICPAAATHKSAREIEAQNFKEVFEGESSSVFLPDFMMDQETTLSGGVGSSSSCSGSGKYKDKPNVGVSSSQEDNSNNSDFSKANLDENSKDCDEGSMGSDSSSDSDYERMESSGKGDGDGDSDRDNTAAICCVCDSRDDEDMIIVCDGLFSNVEGEICNREYHIYCLEPPLQALPRSGWLCPICVTKRSQTMSALNLYESDSKSERNSISSCNDDDDNDSNIYGNSDSNNDSSNNNSNRISNSNSNNNSNGDCDNSIAKSLQRYNGAVNGIEPLRRSNRAVTVINYADNIFEEDCNRMMFGNEVKYPQNKPPFSSSSSSSSSNGRRYGLGNGNKKRKLVTNLADSITDSSSNICSSSNQIIDHAEVPLRPSMRGILRQEPRNTVACWKGSWALDDADFSDKNKVSHFEYKLVKSFDDLFPPSGEYEGFFNLKECCINGKSSYKNTKHEDHITSLTFCGLSGDSEYFVSGFGENEFGSYNLSGTFTSASLFLQIYREYKLPEPSRSMILKKSNFLSSTTNIRPAEVKVATKSRKRTRKNEVVEKNGEVIDLVSEDGDGKGTAVRKVHPSPVVFHPLLTPSTRAKNGIEVNCSEEGIQCLDNTATAFAIDVSSNSNSNNLLCTKKLVRYGRPKAASVMKEELKLQFGWEIYI